MEAMHQWASERFEVVPGYLNTATVGLPTRASLDVLRDRLVEWQAGKMYTPLFDADVKRCRAAYARLVNTAPTNIAIVGHAASAGGLVAGSCEPGTRVLCADGDFTSVLFPFLANPGIDVRLVPIETLIDSIDARTDLVAVSAAQSSTGFLLDLERLADAADAFGARTYLDATQASGWANIDADRFDVTVSHAYKWLCSPRGAAFMSVRPSALSWLRPQHANWYAGDRPWDSIYGAPLRLAADARRYDLSPAWFSFAAAAPTLEMLADLGVDAINTHCVGLANNFLARLGLPSGDSAIVSIDSEASDALTAAGVAHAPRDGRLRFSFFVYNTAEDVEMAADIVLADPITATNGR